MDVVELSREFMKRIEALEAHKAASELLVAGLTKSLDDKITVLTETSKELSDKGRDYEALKNLSARNERALRQEIERLKNDKLELLNRIEKLHQGNQ